MLTASFQKRFAGGPEISVNNLSVGCGVTVLFGASGSGKTTILRCLAGLERPEHGNITFQSEQWIESSRRFFLPSKHRRVGFVPQNYALFPHLSVKENVGYGLNELPGLQRTTRIVETLRWLDIEDLSERLPCELSGGQQQRVALARAVARIPRLLLLDEPLSALDSPTRIRLRGELRGRFSELGIPVILVTHDRLDAMALGDQLVVLNHGRVLQTGAVEEVFNRPANLEVAAIVGTETVLLGQITRTSDGLATVNVNGVELIALAEDLQPGTNQVHLCIRAEDVILVRKGSSQISARNRLSATITSHTPEGPMMRIELDCGFPLKALLTRQACEELALKPGASMDAMIKAPQIHLISFR